MSPLQRTVAINLAWRLGVQLPVFLAYRGNLVDLHDLRRAVRGGCPIETAFAIFA